MTTKELLDKQTRAAFDGDDEMSLQAAIWQMTPAEAAWKPNDETGTIEDILHHLAWCKVMYAAKAFGDCPVEEDVPVGDLARTIDWLRRALEHLLACLAAVTGEALDAPVPTPFHGESAGHLFWVLLMHDISHGGQIQLIRRQHRQVHQGT